MILRLSRSCRKSSYLDELSSSDANSSGPKLSSNIMSCNVVRSVIKTRQDLGVSLYLFSSMKMIPVVIDALYIDLCVN